MWWKRLFDAVERNRAWKIYRHCAAFYGLLNLSIWAKSIGSAAIVIGFVVAYLATMPLWQRLLAGLGAAALASVAALALVIAWKISTISIEVEAGLASGKSVTQRVAITIAVTCLMGAVAGGWWIKIHAHKPTSVFLSEEETQLLRALHENMVLNYQAYRAELAPLYKSTDKLLTDLCGKFKIPGGRVASDCRVDLGRGVRYLVVAPASKDGCFDYDPKTLYITNKVNTIFSMFSGYTVLGDRNWPAAFNSEQDANLFLGIAHAYTKVCTVGGAHRPSFSDVVFVWPTAPKPLAGKCLAIDPEHFNIVETAEAAFVNDNDERLLRFGSIADAKIVVTMARGHSSLCVIGGVPGVNAPEPMVTGLSLIPGDRVTFLD